MKKGATERFTDRVKDYIKYRPSYPEAVLSYLQQAAGLSAGATIADVGAGTGIFTRLLLDAGFNVTAIEPNDAMREAADVWLSSYPTYTSGNGSATATGCPAGTIDLIVCAQAFHWFNNAATRQEFRRILKPDHYVALIWNNRLTNADPFSIAYDQLLKELGSDYNEVNHQKLGEADFKAFYRDGVYMYTAFPNEQIFDEAGLIGRAQSSSYVPVQDTPAGKHFYESLSAIFGAHAVNGQVRFGYDTEVYLGKI